MAGLMVWYVQRAERRESENASCEKEKSMHFYEDHQKTDEEASWSLAFDETRLKSFRI
jgi:hypothetical protein